MRKNGESLNKQYLGVKKKHKYWFEKNNTKITILLNKKSGVQASVIFRICRGVQTFEGQHPKISKNIGDG